MTDLSAADPGDTAPATATVDSARGRRLATIIQGQGLIAMALLIAVYFGLTSEYFFTADNVLIIGATAAPLGIMALAQTFLILSGGIDVSVGSVVAISTVTAGLLMQGGMDFLPAAGLAVLVGSGVGTINALLVVVLTVNPFIATLGTLSVFQGLAFAVTGGRTIVVDNPTLAYVGIGTLWGLPVPFVIFIAAFIVSVIFERFTRWGRTIYAIGGNAEAARLSGLRVKSTRAGLYILSGTSAGLAGVLLLGQLSAASPQVGATFLLSVVTAVILGGASLAGGKGTVVGTLVAVAILGMLNNGFALLGSSSAAQQIALGVALIFAVLLELAGRKLRRGEQ